LAIQPEEGGETALTGPLLDDAALYGVLMKIRDLGLSLVAVKRIPGEKSSHHKV
jgi:hypothetical protein